jgi:hypothetical protein
MRFSRMKLHVKKQTIQPMFLNVNYEILKIVIF